MGTDCVAIDIVLILRWARRSGIISRKVGIRCESSTSVDPPNPGLENHQRDNYNHGEMGLKRVLDFPEGELRNHVLGKTT